MTPQSKIFGRRRATGGLGPPRLCDRERQTGINLPCTDLFPAHRRPRRRNGRNRRNAGHNRHRHSGSPSPQRIPLPWEAMQIERGDWSSKNWSALPASRNSVLDAHVADFAPQSLTLRSRKRGGFGVPLLSSCVTRWRDAILDTAGSREVPREIGDRRTFPDFSIAVTILE